MWCFDIPRCLGDVIVRVVASCDVVTCGFESNLSQIKDYAIAMFCFSAKHTLLTKIGQYEHRLDGSESR
jgi:hypothetical protein